MTLVEFIPAEPGCNVCGAAVEGWSYQPAECLIPPFVTHHRFTFQPCGHGFTGSTAVLFNERWGTYYPHLKERRP